MTKIAGMASPTGTEDIRSHLNLDGIEGKSMNDVVNLINTALLEPMQDYSLLESLPLVTEGSEVLRLCASEACSALLNTRKASGLDSIPNWLLATTLTLLLIPFVIF